MHMSSSEEQQTTSTTNGRTAPTSVPMAEAATAAAPVLLPASNGDAIEAALQATGVHVSVQIQDGHLLISKIKPSASRTLKPLFQIPLVHLLSYTSTSPTLRLSYLASAPAYTLLHLVLVVSSPEPEVEAFLARLSRAAFPAPRRRVLVLVNPIGGKGKGVRISQTVVLPILQAAKCEATITRTTHAGHATEIARDLDLQRYDLVAYSGGDGLLHEILQGFAARPDALKSFRLPLVPIPTGSGNGFSTSLHGGIDGFSVPFACLNIIKGSLTPYNLASAQVGTTGPRMVSFLSTALGLMAECDIGTEHLRWMGDARFMYGVLRGTIAMKPWRGTLFLKVVPSASGAPGGPSISELAAEMKAHLSAADNEKETAVLAEDAVAEDGPLPLAKYPRGPEEDWLRISSGEEKDGKGILYIYGGMVPAASRDLVQWPFSDPSSGVMDMVVQKMTTRSTFIKALTSGESGKCVLIPSQQYYKVSAYHITPPPSGECLISLDGEHLDLSAASSGDAAQKGLTVESLGPLGRTLTLEAEKGRWRAKETFVKAGGIEEALKM